MMATPKNRIDELVAAQVCPITFEPMKDPVIAVDGHTYERTAIEGWFTTNNTSPMTGAVLAHTGLVPNHSLKSLVAELTELKVEQDKQAALKAGQDVKQSSAVLPAGGYHNYFKIDLSRLTSNLQRLPEVCIYDPRNHTFSFLVNGMTTSSLSDPLTFVSLRIPHSLTRNPRPAPTSTPKPSPSPSPTPVPTLASSLTRWSSPIPKPRPSPNPSPRPTSTPTPLATPKPFFYDQDNASVVLQILKHLILNPPSSASPIPVSSEDDVSSGYEVILNDIEYDRRFEPSDKPGVLYEVDSSLEISDAGTKGL